MDNILIDNWGLMGVGISVVVGLLVIIVVYFLTRRPSESSRTSRLVLVLGNCNAGKTLLYWRLVNGPRGLVPKTVSSQIVNEGVAHRGWKELATGLVPVVDIPGHVRLRELALPGQADQAGVIVYLLDSAQFDVRAEGEYLYRILTLPSVQNREIPIVVLCNKEDHIMARSKEELRPLLEKELTERSRLHDVASAVHHSGDTDDIVPLEVDENNEFRFEDAGVSVEFSDISVKMDKLDSFVSLLAKHMPGQS
eukprot:CAMPEP_0119136500 /NCGR_PEP_ID=MMETSP1310-20130426/21553_1 /TAXON_ID=464262 /ORGANISM="Genus nov. species nov., Strain RCC2339" /LENGTH=251 /DNA_ID=CAMNT_0007127491 /DNA_START=68 /DNA_END=823 /DNA_ORIENTATION=+